MRRITFLTLISTLLLGLALTAPATAAPASADRGAWAPNTAYAVNDTVSYGGCTYKVIQAHTSLTGWEPPIVPALFSLVSCGGGTSTNTPAPSASSTRTATAVRTATRTATRTNTPAGPSASPTGTRTNTPAGPTSTRTNTSVPPTLTVTATAGGTTCAVQSAPAGKVLAGYWENWDGAANGVHPGMGWIPLSQVPAAYNVIDLAFPVILPDGTAEWFSGMDSGVKVPTPAEICAAKAAGHWVLLSIGGATAAVDLSQSATVDKFISTIVPILKANNFDGIDIDIESGLVAGSSWSANSTSQNNLIRLIDGVLAQMPANFMLTMAPETAYVTGGQIAYGGPWGAYDPIIQRYLANGRLSWLQMQYYNGSMYGCPATSYSAGTVDGFVQQTQCMMNGFTVAGGPLITIPAGKIVVGLPAQPGAGGGYMAPALVGQAYAQVSSIKGLMTWSINWDGSKGWTFANSKPY